MAGSPQISQGVLNRVRASLTWTDYPALNITAPYLGKAGISLAFNGPRTVQIDTMTGAVQSPEPFVPCTITANLLRTQSLARLYQLQEQLTTLLGDCTLRPDVSGSGVLALYQLTNGALDDVRELAMAGQDPGYMVSFKAYYAVNSALYTS
jgi:hypothetical protein